MRTTGTFTDASGTSGNASATDILPQHHTRSGMILANPSTVDMWYSFSAAAAAGAIGSIYLAAKTTHFYLSGFKPTNRISLYCASAQPFTLHWSP